MKRSLLTLVLLTLTCAGFSQYPSATQPDLWLKFDASSYHDAGTTLCTNGQTIQQVNDSSGHSRNATQTSGTNQPTWYSGVLNGLGMAKLNGTNNYLNSAYTGEIGTVFIVYASDGGVTTAYQGLIGADENNGQSGEGAYELYATNNNTQTFIKRAPASGGTEANCYTYAFPGWHNILGVRYNSSTYTIKGSYHATQWGTGTGSAPMKLIRLPVIGGGYYNNTLGDWYKGYIGEVLIYANPLSDAEYAKVNAYLEAKWHLGRSTYTGGFFWEGNVAPELQMVTSDDCKTWTWQPSVYAPTSGHYVRDVSIYYNTSNATWYMAHTNFPNVAGPYNRSFDVATSPDGITWTFQKTVDCSAIATDIVGGPIWVQDPYDNSLHILAGGVSGSSNFEFEIHPSNPNSIGGTWSAATLLTVTSAPTTMDDMSFVYVGGTYYVVFTNPTINYVNELMQSTSLLGTYTITYSTDFMNLGRREGPNVVKVPGGYICINDATGSGMWYNTLSGAFPGSGSWGTNTSVVYNANNGLANPYGAGTGSNWLARGQFIQTPSNAVSSSLTMLGVGLLPEPSNLPWNWIPKLAPR